jgi:hypothetical protein
MSNYTEYSILQNEIERRKKAFTTLIVSISVGVFFSIFDLIIVNPPIFIISFLTFTLFLFMLRILTIKSLNNFSFNKIFINDHFIKRKTLKSEETFSIKDIVKLNIKKTVKSQIRQIKISLNSGATFYINGLKNFDLFIEKIKNNCSNTLKINYINEPLDFDHPLFYLIFGLIIGSFSVFCMRLMTGLDASSLKLIYISIVVFNFVVGLFFIVTKPISKTIGSSARSSDNLFGGILLTCSTMFLYFFL